MDDPDEVAALWFEACGGKNNMPTSCNWKNVKKERKYAMLHDPARAIEAEYVSPYELIDIDELVASGRKSVEHVLPKSFFKGDLGVCDPLGWVAADRDANSERSNRPLALWPMLNAAVPLRHYVPLFDQRGRLARKWLFMRYTYAEEIKTPPTKAQAAHHHLILWMARRTPISEAEHQMNEWYAEAIGWSNPLLSRDEAERDRFYDSPAFRARVFDLAEITTPSPSSEEQ